MCTRLIYYLILTLKLDNFTIKDSINKLPLLLILKTQKDNMYHKVCILLG